MQTWEETYVLLAIEFDATMSDMPNEIVHLLQAYEVLTNLTSDSTIGEGSNTIAIGRLASATLSPPSYLLYKQARLWYSYDSYRSKLVLDINEITIRFINELGEYGSLTNFVNSLDWPDECIPYYWAQLSENNRISTKNWNVCS